MNANDLYLKFPTFKSERKWQFEKPILFLGSCFSDEIAAKAKYYGLNTHSNPFGTIYHPLVINRFLLDSISNNNFEERIELFQNHYYSFDAAYQFKYDQKQMLIDDLKSKRASWLELMKSSSHLFITFGTAWGYRHCQTDVLVANCLKMPSQFFKKELVSTNEIVSSWIDVIQLIRSINPMIEICFTVSPVRHIRDGIIENNRSKAILIEAVHEITQATNTCYIPTYEIIIDVLRDYRFFKDDLVHPSDSTIQIIWNWLVALMTDESVLNLMKSVVKVRKAQDHRPLNQDNNSLELIRQNIEIERKKISLANPHINW